jgi:tryptophanyl-tRNA synthetase
MAKGDGEGYLFIANIHAIGGVADAKRMTEQTYELAAVLLGCGLDVQKNVLFRESDIPEISELNTFMMHVTPKGLMDRAHAYKATVDANRERGVDVDEGVGMGLYTYPILMAADIFAVDGTHVPVGKDQVQHVEFARDIAGYFNNTFGQTITVPQHVVQPDVAVVPGLDGRKMSKSYDNVVPIFGAPEDILKATKKIVTDSAAPADVKDPEASTIYQIYKAIAPKDDAVAFAKRFTDGGLGYGEAKTILADRIIAEFGGKFASYERYLNDRAAIDKILADGAARTRAKARIVVDRVRKAMGV